MRRIIKERSVQFSCDGWLLYSTKMLQKCVVGRLLRSFAVPQRRLSSCFEIFTYPEIGEYQRFKECIQLFRKPQALFLHGLVSRKYQSSIPYQKNVDIHQNFVSNGVMSLEEWEGLKRNWNKDYRHKDFNTYLTNVVAAYMKEDNYSLAKSILERAKQEEPNLPAALFNFYCHLCYKCNDKEGLNWCLDFVKANHSKLDEGNVRSLMNGLCQGDNWKVNGLEVLEIAVGEAVTLTPRVYEPLLVAASKHNDSKLIIKLLSEMVGKDLIPSRDACISIFSTLTCDFHQNAVNSDFEKIIFNLLNFFKSRRHYMSKEEIFALKNWFERNKSASWKTSLTRISPDGRCKSCGHTLDKMTLTSKEFETLRDQVTEKVIYGQDIFQKTRPDEFEAFTHFVKEGGPYDIVVDGLNVARMIQKRHPSRMLRQVIVYLVQVCGYKCLVLGRRHMLSASGTWQSKHMNAVTDLADCFFTENISQDDPFMLYATLHSGPRCMYMTRDMLRDHKALLDPEVHLSFIKWQRTHQMSPVNFIDGKLICKPIRKHDTAVQSSGDNWHIPYDDDQSPRYSYQVPIDWLCARKT